MNHKYELRISAMAIVAILLVAVGVVQGQSPDDNGLDQGSEAPVGGVSTEFILAQAPQTINYQGYLTDSNGNPLNGQYDMVFNLYDAVTDGTMEWGPETHVNVQVTDGLFQVALGTTVVLEPNDFDEALFLAVNVDGADVSPRQPLRAVPYAFGLVPGAEVQGDPTSSQYALRIENEGLSSTDRGLYVKGEQYGIYAEEVGEGSDVGIYSPDFIHAAGFRSNSDSYVWVPATAGNLYPTSGCTAYQTWHGSVRIECTASGSKAYNIGITVPAVLYGQDVRVQSMRVYYDLDSTASYIDSTRLRRLTDARSSLALVEDSTNRTSTSSTSYYLTSTDNYTLTAASGALNLNLTLWHDGDINHDITIGGVRLQLRHYDEP